MKEKGLDDPVVKRALVPRPRSPVKGERIV